MAFLTCSAVTFLRRKPTRGSVMPESVHLRSGGAFVYGLSYDTGFVLVHISGDSEFGGKPQPSSVVHRPLTLERDHSIARSPGD